jgi:hypothetical protein
VARTSGPCPGFPQARRPCHHSPTRPGNLTVSRRDWRSSFSPLVRTDMERAAWPRGIGGLDAQIIIEAQRFPHLPQVPFHVEGQACGLRARFGETSLSELSRSPGIETIETRGTRGTRGTSRLSPSWFGPQNVISLNLFLLLAGALPAAFLSLPLRGVQKKRNIKTRRHGKLMMLRSHLRRATGSRMAVEWQ